MSAHSDCVQIVITFTSHLGFNCHIPSDDDTSSQGKGESLLESLGRSLHPELMKVQYIGQDTIMSGFKKTILKKNVCGQKQGQINILDLNKMFI